jgi:hypothetical protein
MRVRDGGEEDQDLIVLQPARNSLPGMASVSVSGSNVLICS